MTFKMTHFAFVNKSQNQFDYTLILTLIDKCKMCHFECHGLKYYLTVSNLKIVLNVYVESFQAWDRTS